MLLTFFFLTINRRIKVNKEENIADTSMKTIIKMFTTECIEFI